MRTILILAACTALLTGCRRTEAISFEQFVNTTVELRRLAASAVAPSDFQAKKATVERKRGVTDADLDAFTRTHAADVKLMSAAWDSIEQRLDRLSQRDAATMPTPQPPHGPAARGVPAVRPPVMGGAVPAGTPRR